MEPVVNSAIQNLQSEETDLKREIDLFGGVNILMGVMVGSGIFYLGSFVLMRSGMSMGLSLFVWGIGGLITLLSGLCYAELGAMLPKAGGPYIYDRESYGEALAFTGGLSGFILRGCGSTAGLAIAFSTILASFLGTLIPISENQIKIVAVVAIVFLTLINIVGIKQGSIIQNIFTVGKLIPIVIILIAGLLMGKESPDLSLMPRISNASSISDISDILDIPPSPPSLPISIVGNDTSIASIMSMLAFSVIATFWAYEGWSNLNSLGEEIKNPKKNIPRAIIISISLVTLLYTLFNFALYKVIPMEEISLLIANGNSYLGTEAAKILFGSVGAILVGFCMTISVFGALNGCVMVLPRSCLAMARDGVLPRAFAAIHPKYKTPHISLIVHMVIAIVLIYTRNLSQITSLVVFSGMLFNSLTFYSVIRLRKKYPDMERPYRVKTWIVYVTIAIMVALSLNTLREDPVTSTVGLIVPFFSYIIYLFIKKSKEKKSLRHV